MKSFCPFCEKEYDNLEVQTSYEITTLNGVTAEWQKKYIVCPDCGAELYNGELHDENLRVLYAACKVPDMAKPVEDLCDYVIKLRNENAELRARLEKAIELPVKVGDIVYDVIYDETTNEPRWHLEMYEVTNANLFMMCHYVHTRLVFLVKEEAERRMDALNGLMRRNI